MRWLLSFYLICIFLLFCLTPVNAQNRFNLLQDDSISFQRYTTINGLAQNSVYTFMQDRIGYIWIGTDEGLSRFDGYNFTNYKVEPLNKNALSSNTVYAIFQDHTGTLWVGTSDGLNRYNPSTNNFTIYSPDDQNPNSISNKNIKAIYEDRQNNLWIGTNGGGLNYFDHNSGKFIAYKNDAHNKDSISSNNITTIYQDQAGTLWIGTDNGLNSFDPQTKKFQIFRNHPQDPHSLSSDNIKVIFEDNLSRLWIGTNKGLNIFDSKNQTATIFLNDENDPNSISRNFITAIYQDKNSDIWVGTINGLNKYDAKKNNFKIYHHNPKLTTTLGSDRISAIMQDRSGALWVGTYFGGLAKFDPLSKRFNNYLDNIVTLTDTTNLYKNIWTLTEDSHNSLWVGTSHGLLEIEQITNQVKIYQEENEKFNFSEKVISSTKEDNQNRLWIGTSDGLYKLDLQTKKISQFSPDAKKGSLLPSDAINYLYRDSQGFIWICTDGGGLNRLDTATENIITYRHNSSDKQSLSNDSVTGIVEDKEGNFWISTTLGLNKLDIKSGKFKTYFHTYSPFSLSSNYTSQPFIDRDNHLWFSSEHGLQNFDNTYETFTLLNESQGLANNVVTNILQDNNGNIWVSTNRGISKLDPRNNKFINYDLQDGLNSIEFNGNASFKSKNGYLYFGGSNGYVKFDPSRIQDNSFIPPIVITSIKLFDKPLEREHSLLFTNADELKDRTLVLAYNENFLSIEFAALSYQLQGRNRYLYKMDGINNDWIDGTNRRFANFTQMSPGEYTFRIKASNSDGHWNELGIALKIIIKPPFWKTNTAYFIYLLLIIGAIYLINQYQVRALAARNRLLEATVQKRTSELEAKNQELIIAKESLESNYQELDNKNQELDEKNQLLDNKNQQLDKKIAALIDSQRQADRIFSALAEALPGTVLDGKYRLDERIGSGGFGAVYRSTHLTLQREVAVKVFKPTPGNDSVENLERFKMEAISACRINHPNAVSILDSGISSDGIAYLVMELLKGKTLKEELRSKNSFSLERCAQILLPLCDVLSKTHEMGIVHRDIKPDNIFLHRDNDREIIKVLDFGIAKLMEDEQDLDITNLTGTGKLIGTPVYISPERFAGLAYNGKADVYSLGVILYEMLTGKLPFNSSSQGIMALIEMQSREPIPLKSIAPHIPDEVVSVVMKTLTKNPDDRLSANELSQQFFKAIGHNENYINKWTDVTLKNQPTITNHNNEKNGNTITVINRLPLNSEVRWSVVEQLFFKLLDAPVEKREHLLIQACGDDEKLCEEVRSLLLAHEEVHEDRFVSSIIKFNSPIQPIIAIGETLTINNNIFYIIKSLGQDTFSKLYLASNKANDSLVTLKIFVNNLAASTFSSKHIFVNDQVRNLSHPNIARIDQHFITNIDNREIIVLVMENLEGENLQDLLMQSELLFINDKINIIKQLANALLYAHNNSLVHGSLVPANIRVINNSSLNNRQIKILNFGLNSLLQNAPQAMLSMALPGLMSTPASLSNSSAINLTSQTLNESLKETKDNISQQTAHKLDTLPSINNFYAPELLNSEQQVNNGKPEKIDKCSDIYSFSLISYRLLTNKFPNSSGKFNDYEKGNVAKEITLPLENFIMAGLNTDPIKRPSSIKIVVDIISTV